MQNPARCQRVGGWRAAERVQGGHRAPESGRVGWRRAEAPQSPPAYPRLPQGTPKYPRVPRVSVFHVLCGTLGYPRVSWVILGHPCFHFDVSTFIFSEFAEHGHRLTGELGSQITGDTISLVSWCPPNARGHRLTGELVSSKYPGHRLPGELVSSNTRVTVSPGSW